MTWNAETLAERNTRATAAAAEAGRSLGLTVTEPTVLYDGFSIAVHLKPAPVVARVPLVLPKSLRDPVVATRRQQTELDITQWLVELGKPVVTPSPLVPREPVRRDGYSMTFWEYADHDKSVDPDYLAGTRSAAELHAVLADYPGGLPWLSPVTSAVPDGLTELSEATALLDSDDLDRIHREWEVLGPVLMTRAGFEAALPEARIQPIHGDAPAYNLIPLIPQMPSLGDALKPIVEHWRTMPFAGGLG